MLRLSTAVRHPRKQSVSLCRSLRSSASQRGNLLCFRLSTPRHTVPIHPQHHLFSATAVLPTTVAEKVGDDWQEKFNGLEAQSKQLLETAAAPTEQLEELIREWEGLLLLKSELSMENVDCMKRIYEVWKTSYRSKETNVPYKSMFHVLSKLSGPGTLSIMQDWEVLSGNIDLAPPESYFDAVIAAYAADTESCPREGAGVAMELIQHLESTYNAERLPNVHSYQNVVRCLSRAILQEDPVDQSRVKPLLDTMEKLIEKLDPEDIAVNDTTFKALAFALHDALVSYSFYIKKNETIQEPTALHRSREWLLFWSTLMDPENQSRWKIIPNFVTFLEETVNAIVRIHMHELRTIPDATKDVGGAEACTQLILQLCDIPGADALPSGRHYLGTIQVWNLLRRNFDVEQQHAMLLKRMKDQHFLLYNDQQPISDDESIEAAATESWNNLLRAYLHCNLPQQVEELWDLNNKPGHRRIKRNQESFTIYFRALVGKRDGDTPQAGMSRAMKAHKLMSKTLQLKVNQRIFQPTAEHFASVMVGWQRSYHKDAALYCQEIFDFLLREASTHAEMEPTRHHFNALLLSWGFSKRSEANTRIMDALDTMRSRGLPVGDGTLSAVLFSLSRSKNSQGLACIEQILKDLENTSSDEPTVLSTRCYNSLLYAQCNSKAHAALCEDTFQRLWHLYAESGFHKKLQPNSVTFSLRIDAMTNSGKVNSALRAEEILNEMETLAAEGKAEYPGLVVYTAVMKACWKDTYSGGPARAQSILDRMEAAYESGHLATPPDANVMTILMHAWAKSNSPYKARAVWSILVHMKQKYARGDLSMQPSAYTYAAILNACAFTQSTDQEIREEALKVALSALQEMGACESGLNQRAFRSMFQVVCRQVEDMTQRHHMAARVFQRCCEEGCVEPAILSILRLQVPSLYKKLPSNGTELSIPEEWCRKTLFKAT